MKRINADYYTEDKYVGYCENRHQIFGKNGTLFAYGIYPTKIKKEDLPNHYVYGYSSGGYRYFKTKGIIVSKLQLKLIKIMKLYSMH